MKNKQAVIIKQLTDRELMFSLVSTQFLVIAAASVLGFFLFDGISSFTDLFQFNKDIFLVGGTAGVLVVLLDVFFMKVLPPSVQDDGGINERIFTSLTYPMIFVIALLVAISEEVLFRGVIQTHIGLLWASLIFAMVHYRYLFNWFLFFNVMLLSFLIGMIYEWTHNLLVTIFMHFVIDFVLGVIVKKKGERKL
ncbi:lysostaphin resistance A-like protein [Peribacillus sp. SCS-155]|uniref:CPBP family intramembrane glutamic endopeptidase n=1 Tax=Peribacillus sedimenti TaxID=3115297 RepID=UPI003906ABB7